MGTLLDTLVEAIFLNIRELKGECKGDDIFQLYYLLGTMEKAREAFAITKAGKVVEKGPVAKYSKMWERYLAVLEYLCGVSTRGGEKDGDVLRQLKQMAKKIYC
jgi:hypothetical protein